VQRLLAEHGIDDAERASIAAQHGQTWPEPWEAGAAARRKREPGRAGATCDAVAPPAAS
jgi:hypothetical protein